MPSSSREIAEDIRRRIAEGEFAPEPAEPLPPGEAEPQPVRLPSIAEFARYYKVTPRTMHTVLERLRFAGIIRSEQGRGYFVV